MLSFFIYSLAAHGQLWAIIEGIVSLTQCWSLVLLKVDPKLSNLVEHLVGFEPGAFLFNCNLLSHGATLPKLEFLRWFDL